MVASVVINLGVIGNLHGSNSEHFILTDAPLDRNNDWYIYKLDKSISHERIVRHILQDETKIVEVAREVFNLLNFRHAIEGIYTSVQNFKSVFLSGDLFEKIVQNVIICSVNSTELLMDEIWYDFSYSPSLRDQVSKTLKKYTKTVVEHFFPNSWKQPMRALSNEDFNSIFPDFVTIFRNNASFFLNRNRIYSRISSIDVTEAPINFPLHVQGYGSDENITKIENYLLDNLLYTNLKDAVRNMEKPNNFDKKLVEIAIRTCKLISENFSESLEGLCELQYRYITYFPQGAEYYEDAVQQMQNSLDAMEKFLKEQGQREQILRRNARHLGDVHIPYNIMVNAIVAQGELQTLPNNLYEISSKAENLRKNIQILKDLY